MKSAGLAKLEAIGWVSDPASALALLWLRKPRGAARAYGTHWHGGADPL